MENDINNPDGVSDKGTSLKELWEKFNKEGSKALTPEEWRRLDKDAYGDYVNDKATLDPAHFDDVANAANNVIKQ